MVVVVTLALVLATGATAAAVYVTPRTPATAATVAASTSSPPTVPLLPWETSTPGTSTTPTLTPTPQPSAPQPSSPQPSLPPAPAGMNTAGVRSTIASVIEVAQTGNCYEGGALGTGWPLGGDHFLTAAHVVSGETNLIAYTGLGEAGNQMGGTPHPAKLVAYDTTNDVAIIAVPGVSMAALPLVGSSPSVGEPVAVVGLALGILSSAQMSVTSDGPYWWHGLVNSAPLHTTNWVLSTAGIQQGDSGGPVVDSQGRVVGMADAGDSSLSIAVDITNPTVEQDIAAAAGENTAVGAGTICPSSDLTFSAPPPTPTPAPTPFPTSPPTQTPMPMPMPTPTPTQTPTPTPTPKPTPVPTPTPTSMPKASPSPTSSPTP